MGIREISASSFVRQGKRSSYLPPRLTRMDLANTCIGKKYLAFTNIFIDEVVGRSYHDHIKGLK